MPSLTEPSSLSGLPITKIGSPSSGSSGASSLLRARSSGISTLSSARSPSSSTAKRAVHGKHFAFAVESLDLSAGRAANDVQVGHDLARLQEETAAGHQGFAVGVVCRNGHDGGFYSFDELRKTFVGAGYGGEKKHQRKGEKRGYFLIHVVNTRAKTRTSAVERGSRAGDLVSLKR